MGTILFLDCGLALLFTTLELFAAIEESFGIDEALRTIRVHLPNIGFSTAETPNLSHDLLQWGVAAVDRRPDP